MEGAYFHLSLFSHCSLFEWLCCEEVHIFQKCWKPFPSHPSLQAVALSQQESQRVTSSILSACQWKLKHKVEFTSLVFFFLCSMLPSPFSFYCNVSLYNVCDIIYSACIHKSSVYFQRRIFFYLVIVQNKTKCWDVNLPSSPQTPGKVFISSWVTIPCLTFAEQHILSQSCFTAMVCCCLLRCLCCPVLFSLPPASISSQNLHV